MSIYEPFTFSFTAPIVDWMNIYRPDRTWISSHITATDRKAFYFDASDWVEPCRKVVLTKKVLKDFAGPVDLFFPMESDYFIQARKNLVMKFMDYVMTKTPKYDIIYVNRLIGKLQPLDRKLPIEYKGDDTLTVVGSEWTAVMYYEGIDIDD